MSASCALALVKRDFFFVCVFPLIFFLFSFAVSPYKNITPVKTPSYNKQPITRTEDRLFDRGWVRSAMATRKCGNIYFPKYFMAVRPFFTRNFFQELFGLEGSKNLLENFVRCTICKSRTVSYDPRVFFKKIFLVLYAAYVYPFWVVSL